MKSRVFGEGKDTVIIETIDDTFEVVLTKDAIVKMWFSDGTILGIKYDKYSKIYPNIWHIKVLNQGYNNYIYKQCYKETLLYNSDVYETDAWLVHYRIIPRTYDTGDVGV